MALYKMKGPALFTPAQYQDWQITRRGVHRSLMALSQVCNYATTHDKQGFNATDAQFGHDLARRKEGRLTLGQVNAAHKMLIKYRKQIERLIELKVDELPRLPSGRDLDEALVSPENVAWRMRWWGPDSQRVPVPEPSLTIHSEDIYA